MIDRKALEEHVRGILVALGDDPDREGLKDTPKRVAKMYEEVFAGMNYSNDDLAAMFDKTFSEGMDDDELYDEDGGDILDCGNEDDELAPSKIVVVKDIDIFSYCEHHLALMYDMKVTVAYIPHGKVIGLSKIARVADMVGKRLQLQERIGSDIADIIIKITGSDDVAVVIEGKHSCMTARGIKRPNSVTKTTTLRGRFRKDPNLLARL
ncbi:MAG: GTP cyclohydrolase I [Lachnospiraceae bacterium]|nr:GTP cyclohydrolase I [Lachnospiraceae bacterium]